MSTSQTNSPPAQGRAIVFYLVEIALILGVSYGLMAWLGPPKLDRPGGNRTAGGPAMDNAPEAELSVEPRWANIDAMLAAAPKTELVAKDFEFEGIKYTILAPAKAEIEAKPYSGWIKVPVSPVATLEMGIGQYPLEMFRKPSTYFLSRPKGLIFSDADAVVTEFEGNEPERYEIHANCLVGHRDYNIHLDRPEGVKAKGYTLEDMLLAFKCARSLKLKEADPTKPKELLEKYGARVQTGEGDKITGIMFPDEACAPLLAIAAQCPDVESIELRSNRLKPDSLSAYPKFAHLKKLFLKGRIANKQNLQDALACKGLERLDIEIDVDSPTALDGIENLANLTYLEIGNMPKTAAPSISKLGKLTKLQTLDARCIDFDGNFEPGEWDFLSNLKDLTNLKLTFVFHDPEAASLTKLAKLEKLELPFCAFSDAGLTSLGELKNLTELKLNGFLRTSDNNDCKINGSGLAGLRGLDKLQTLELADIWITDDSLKLLKDLPALESLTIRNAKITDAGLVHLQSLPKVKSITLSNNQKVTDAGKKKLKEALPKVNISAY